MGNPSLLNVAYYRELIKLVDSMVTGVKSLGVKNVTGGTLNAGTVVYVSGVSNGIPTVAKAKANVIGTMPSVGILTTNIANNQLGLAQFVGMLTNVDTSAFAAGNKLYVSAATAGAVTASEPAHPNISQAVAIVLMVSATTGVLFVLPGIDPHGIDKGTNLNSFKIGDGTAGSKSLVFSTTAESSLAWTPTAARTLTLPDATDTLVGRATSDTLSNKTYTGFSITVSGGFGCNGAGAQSPYSLGAASTDPLVASLQNALKNCGIGS